MTLQIGFPFPDDAVATFLNKKPMTEVNLSRTDDEKNRIEKLIDFVIDMLSDSPVPF